MLSGQHTSTTTPLQSYAGFQGWAVSFALMAKLGEALGVILLTTAGRLFILYDARAAHLWQH